MNFGKIASVSVCIGLMTGPLMMVAAQDRGLTADLSLMMLLETGPSDNSSYPRMVFIKYKYIVVAYIAYTR